MDKKTKVFGTIALVLACLGVMLLMDIPQYLKYKNNEITNMNDENLVLNKGDLIQGTVDMALGAAVEEYSTNFGVRTSKDSSKLYYVIWLDNNNFALYETGNKDDYDTLDKITDETFAFFESQETYEESGDLNDIVYPTTELEITGRVVNMPSDVRGYFENWYNESFDDGQFASSTEPLMITNAAFDRFFMLVIVGAVSAVLAVVFLVLTIIFWKKSKEDAVYGY